MDTSNSFFDNISYAKQYRNSILVAMPTFFGCGEMDGLTNNFGGGHLVIQYGCHPACKFINFPRRSKVGRWFERVNLHYCGRGK